MPDNHHLHLDRAGPLHQQRQRHPKHHCGTASGSGVRRADQPDDAAEMVAASAALAFDSHVPVAVLFSQRLIGAKVFVK